MVFGRRDEEGSEPSQNDEVIEETGRFRWLPGVVVTTAFAGFIALAWHAYHYGAQSVGDGDLVVVEADQTPMKEKPLDPGGMKFPNQDKTVFETFAGNGGNPPKVERIMPPPEEPMPRNVDASETKTWINEKLKEPSESLQPAAGEQAAEANSIVEAEAKQDVKPDAVVTHVKKVEDAIKKEETKLADTKKAETVKEEKKPEPKPAAVKTETKKDTGGSQRIQLGAYGSESEAKTAWTKMQSRFPELKGKTVYVVKADLGDKGIFYRLRAGGFADAKRFCTSLSAKGQACLMVP